MRRNATLWRPHFSSPLSRSYSALGAIALLFFPVYVFAHPMGNFSVNHYSKITLENDGIRVRYLIDLAEIPTYQELKSADISTTAIDPNSIAVINYVALRGA